VIEADDKAELQLLPPTLRKLVANNDGLSLYDQTMEVDLMLLTNTTASKRAKRSNKLDDYMAAQAIDLNTTSADEKALLNDPWSWWLEQI
jgi:hypothetical protein